MTAGRRDFLKLGGVGAAGSLLVAPETLCGAPARRPASACENFDVVSFGAKGDGKTIDTPAVNRAIEAAAAAGGGVVRFPAGSYLCFSIHLKSNVALYLGPGATIVAAETPGSGSGGYDAPEPNQWDHYQDFGHSHWHNSLVWGEEISDVSIFGPGRIWGKGLSRGAGDKPLAPGVGNKSIGLKNCHNVTLRDFSILHGGHFGILATGVDNLTIDNLIIDTNRDAMDIDCCRNVRVSNCTVNSPWDDGICLKSSYGLGLARSTDNVTVANCYVTGGYQEGTVLDGTWKRFGPDERVPRNGRIKFGTESNGGFRNITITNCMCELCRGIALETVDGAMLEDVSISNITMREIVDVPFFLRLGSRMRGPAGLPIGQLRRVLISNIVVSVSNPHQAAIVSGIPGHEIEDVRFADIQLVVPGGGTKDATIQPGELENGYPEPYRFGPMPAYGFFIRHVKGIELRDVEIKCMQPDARPAFALDEVEGAEFMHVKTPRGPGATWSLTNVKDFGVTQSRPFLDSYFESVRQKTL
ncbi:MAG TPA: glycoside hydrolase family 28 protein [Candidatus Acidoferrales bacterium]|nr:glycoside hydrolase family 28 protein [Candidatus Acidoferrales bacterium]